MTTNSSNITLLYYTANLLPEFFAKNVRDHLFETAQGKPIICISQKPTDFGVNVVCDDLVPCLHSVYDQILRGAKAAKTKYIACCEDDTLYVPEHFDFESPEGTFAYNISHWHLRPTAFYFRGHRIMSQCISERDLMIETLELRFKRFPDNASIIRHFGEPGRGEQWLGLPRVPIMGFKTADPPITFRHRDSLSNIRKLPERAPRTIDLPPWGNAEALWKRIYG